jgi:hypothetical protein|uniref:Uncharacterized protein n=1 Tax=Populus trichocarpa TaxID=3694 RepID=A0A2K1XQG1_POPTR
MMISCIVICSFVLASEDLLKGTVNFAKISGEQIEVNKRNKIDAAISPAIELFREEKGAMLKVSSLTELMK